MFHLGANNQLPTEAAATADPEKESEAVVVDATDGKNKIQDDTLRKSAHSFGVEIWTWYLIFFCILLVLFSLSLTAWIISLARPDWISTSRMTVPVTQTLGLWVSTADLKMHVFDDRAFGSIGGVSSSCSIFKNDTLPFSSMHVRPVILGMSGRTVDSILLIML